MPTKQRFSSRPIVCNALPSVVSPDLTGERAVDLFPTYILDDEAAHEALHDETMCLQILFGSLRGPQRDWLERALVARSQWLAMELGEAHA